MDIQEDADARPPDIERLLEPQINMRQFCLIPLSGMINCRVMGCQVDQEISMGGLRRRREAQKHRKSPRLLLPLERR